MNAAGCLSRKGRRELGIVSKFDERLEWKHFGPGGSTAILEQLESGKIAGKVKFAEERMNDGQTLRFFDGASKSEPNVVVDHSAEASFAAAPSWAHASEQT